MIDSPRIYLQRYNPPFYSGDGDWIGMCHERQYENPEVFWATFWHEMVHATGASWRLNRPFGTFNWSRMAHSQDVVTLTEELIAAHGSILMMDVTKMRSPFWKQYNDLVAKVPYRLEHAKGEADKAVTFILRGYVARFGERY